ncbi:MAG TPA: hypothetical protein VNM37_06835, partial [Candidatus Dormibacteraeota bacterium]|nr:hypothetical protein [Candidatus Dormibacteraeota bacterium]
MFNQINEVIVRRGDQNGELVSKSTQPASKPTFARIGTSVRTLALLAAALLSSGGAARAATTPTIDFGNPPALPIETVIDRPTEAQLLDITNPDVPNHANWQLTRSSSNPTLVPEENIFFGFAQESYYVTVTPAFGQIGTADITITVHNGPESATLTFPVHVSGPSPGSGRF